MLDTPGKVRPPKICAVGQMNGAPRVATPSICWRGPATRTTKPFRKRDDPLPSFFASVYGGVRRPQLSGGPWRYC
jgi:hypothetical protein